MDTFTAKWQTKIQNLQSILEKSKIADRFESIDVSGIDKQFFAESSSIVRNGSDGVIVVPSSSESITSSAEQILNITNYRDYEDCERSECHLCKLIRSDIQIKKDATPTNFGGETFRVDDSNLSKRTTIDWDTIIESIKDEVVQHIQKYRSKQQNEKQQTEARRRCLQNLQYELEGNSQRALFLLKELEDLI